MCMAWRFHFPIRNYDFKGFHRAYSLYFLCEMDYCSKVLNTVALTKFNIAIQATPTYQQM